VAHTLVFIRARLNAPSSVRGSVTHALRRSLHDLGEVRKLAAPSEPVTVQAYQRMGDHSGWSWARRPPIDTEVTVVVTPAQAEVHFWIPAG
jgi:hypothetical protein